MCLEDKYNNNAGETAMLTLDDAQPDTVNRKGLLNKYAINCDHYLVSVRICLLINYYERVALETYTATGCNQAGYLSW